MGAYKRTPLTAARQRLTWNRIKEERLLSELERTLQDRKKLQQEIAKLEGHKPLEVPITINMDDDATAQALTEFLAKKEDK